jgi:hypothetical protein
VQYGSSACRLPGGSSSNRSKREGLTGETQPRLPMHNANSLKTNRKLQLA